MAENKNTTLIERYHISDDEQRTCLFQSHQQLRREFMRIDLAGPQVRRPSLCASR
jgi:hypothetical protein